MRVLKHAALLCFGILAAVPVQVQAQSQDEKKARQTISEEAVSYFGGLCIQTRGEPNKIARTMAERKVKGAQLSDDGVRTLLDGQPGDIGWVVVTEAGAELQLLVKPPSTCTLRVLDSYGDVVAGVTEDLLKAMSQPDGFSYRKAMDETRKTNGGAERLIGYFLNWKDGGWSGALSVSHIEGDGKEIPPQTHFTLELRQTS